MPDGDLAGAAFDVAPAGLAVIDGFFTLDLDFRFTWANAQVERLFAFGRPLVGARLSEVSQGNLIAVPFASLYERALRDQTPVHIEEYSAPVRAWLEVHAYPSPKGVSVYFRDITQRKTTEQAMAQLSAIVESSGDAIIGKTLDDVIVSWNAAAESMFGYAAADAVAERISFIIAPGASGDLPARYERVRRGERVPPFETLGRRKDGTVIHIALTLSPIKDAAGKVVGSSAICRDITEQKVNVEALRNLSETLRAILDASPVPMWALDPTGSVMLWNKAGEHLYGWSEREALGRWPPYIRPEDEVDYRALVERYGRGEVIRGLEKRRYCKDGTPVDLSIWTAPLRDADGKLIATVGVTLDLTERKRLEQQLLHSQKMEAVALLAGGVSHDFSNLLTVITGYARMLLFDLDPGGEPRQFAEEIVFAAERAGVLTRQLLAFSRRQISQPRLLDLNEIVRSMEKMLCRILGEDIQLVTALEDNPGMVEADPGQIEQVIANLAVNARDAMPQGGRLTIETAFVPAPGQVMLAVGDTGCGMTPEVQARIFEPFFTTKEKGRGTGLGLAIVYGIVKQSNGDISVASEPGRGSTFRVCLPRVENAGPVAREAGSAAELSGGFETVLVVEDEDAVRRLLRDMLCRLGYTVLDASGGREALALCASHSGPIHVMITDVVMPEMTGLELARAMAAERPATKLVYMTGYADKAQQELSTARLILKPFSAETVARTVRAALES